MNWLKVDVTVASEATEALSSAMIELAPAGIQVNDTGEPSAPVSLTTLTIYPPETASVEDIKAQLAVAIERIRSQGLKVDPVNIDISAISDENWAENYKQFFKPVRIGRVLIKPSWEDVSASAEDVVVELDPGMAFGTGNHATTEGCLRFLQQEISGGESVFDIGTGSGILAIAAVKLGAAKAIAIDNDPVAIKIAKENAQANGVADKIDFLIADFSEFAEVSAKIVVANITGPLIIKFLPSIVAKVKGLRTLICSGATLEQKKAVVSALRDNGFAVKEVFEKLQWVTLVSDFG